MSAVARGAFRPIAPKAECAGQVSVSVELAPRIARPASLALAKRLAEEGVSGLPREEVNYRWGRVSVQRFRSIALFAAEINALVWANSVRYAIALTSRPPGEASATCTSVARRCSSARRLVRAVTTSAQLALSNLSCVTVKIPQPVIMLVASPNRDRAQLRIVITVLYHGADEREFEVYHKFAASPQLILPRCWWCERSPVKFAVLLEGAA